MHFSLLNSIHETAEAEWDAILGSHDMAHRHAFAAGLEESQPDRVYRYLVMRNDAGELVAHANICVIATSVDLFLDRRTMVARLLKWIRTWRPKFLISNVIECGNPLAIGQPFVFRKDLNDSARQEMVQATHQAMIKLSQQENADVLAVRDFFAGDNDSLIWRSLQMSGFIDVPNLENAVLEVRWKSFDDYLKSLRSHYRYRIKVEKKKATKAGIRRELVTDFACHAPRLAELWQATADQAGAQLREELNTDFFVSMSQRLGKSSFVSLFWLGQTIVAFTLYFDNGDELRPLYVGFDYSHNEEASLVFNSYYDWIETAIDLGYRRIELGLTTYEPKLRIGGHLEKLTVLVRHRQSWLTAPAALIYRWLTPQQKPETRHVFSEPGEGKQPPT